MKFLSAFQCLCSGWGSPAEWPPCAFPVDGQTVASRYTGREPEEIARCEAYFRAQQLFGVTAGTIDYSRVLVLDLDAIRPSLAGPKRPQDRIDLPEAWRSKLAGQSHKTKDRRSRRRIACPDPLSTDSVDNFPFLSISPRPTSCLIRL